MQTVQHKNFLQGAHAKKDFMHQCVSTESDRTKLASVNTKWNKYECLTKKVAKRIPWALHLNNIKVKKSKKHMWTFALQLSFFDQQIVLQGS